MKFGRRLGRRARWAVPGAAVVAVGAVVAGTAVAAGAQAAPALPARSVAQLLADVQRATGPGPLTGTIQETANLGIPSLPGLGDNSSLSGLSMLSGTHAATIWYADPTHVRIAEQVQLGETDLRLNGRHAWLWDSKAQTATRIVLPAVPSGRQAGAPDIKSPAAGMPPTPQQVARQILAAVGPTTAVSLQQNVTVAGQAAYQLVVAPKDSRSLIGRIRIAVDAGRYLPVRVQVFARGAKSPAFQIGFTALTFGRPAASNFTFTFTPPPGAKVKTMIVPAMRPGFAPGQTAPVRLPVRVSGRGRPMRIVRLPRGSLYSGGASGWTGVAPAAGVLGPNDAIGGPGGPTVLGQGWLSVLVLGAHPKGGLASARRIETVHGAHNPVSVAAASSSGGVASVGSAGSVSSSNTAVSVIKESPSSGAPMVAGPNAAMLQVLLRAAKPVHGKWGSGRLLRTSLFSILITAKGPVLVGAVTPAVLYADAAGVK